MWERWIEVSLVYLLIYGLFNTSVGIIAGIFYLIPKYHMKILLVDFYEKVGRENILKLAIGNESLHQDSNDNGVRMVNFATSKNLVVKSTMFLH